MDAIRKIVQEIVFMCRVRGVQVSDTLGAFMARAVVLENPVQFPLNKELNETDVQELIRLATERLLATDSPPLETVKMQVAFDTARVEETEVTGRAKAAREQREGALVTEIAATRLRPGNDVEALTSLYRKIFNFLVVRSGLELGADRPAEREIAAALESVFPRIGLKAFTALAHEDKGAQLAELAHIVLGIRLFNRHIGKGGSGISDLPRATADTASDLLSSTQEELEFCEISCAQYEGVIAKRLRAVSDGAESEGAERLVQELTNRRQYTTYVQQLDEAFKQAGAHAEQLTRLLLEEMGGLKELIGARSSVPKEQVYPKFDALAKLWESFGEEMALLQARQATLRSLRMHRQPFETAHKASEVMTSRGARDEAHLLPPADAKAARAALEAAGVADAGESEPAEPLGAQELEEAHALTIELESFCPVTLVQRGGLLLPASLGHVARHQGRHYAFVDAPAKEAFVSSPESYVKGVLATARKAPELIHMLRLQEYFPAASIAEIMRQHAAADGGAGAMLAPPRSVADGQCQTCLRPMHFTDKHIDKSYEWNEWELRRRALQLANLRKMKTTSQQTAQSALRRDAETQVYLPAENGTMTGVSTGTSVPVSCNYVAGLRGSPDTQMEVVNMTYDPDVVIGKYR